MRKKISKTQAVPATSYKKASIPRFKPEDVAANLRAKLAVWHEQVARLPEKDKEKRKLKNKILVYQTRLTETLKRI